MRIAIETGCLSLRLCPQPEILRTDLRMIAHNDLKEIPDFLLSI